MYRSTERTYFPFVATLQLQKYVSELDNGRFRNKHSVDTWTVIRDDSLQEKYIRFWTENTPASTWQHVGLHCHTDTAPPPSVRLGDVGSEGVSVTRLQDTWTQLQVRRGVLCRTDNVLKIKSQASLVLGTPRILREDAHESVSDCLIHMCQCLRVTI